MPISVILFDLGGTLLHFEGIQAEVFARMEIVLADELLRLGYAIDPAGFAAEFSHLIQDAALIGRQTWVEIPTFETLSCLLAKHGYPNPPESELRAALRLYYAVSQSHWLLEEDALPLLQELTRAGYRLAVISNASDSEDVITLLHRHQLLGYFDKVWISCDVGLCKPHPRVFSLAADFFQTSPAEMLMIGDTLETDVAGARNIGIHSLWIRRRANPRLESDTPEEFQPEYVLDTLAEIPSWLEITDFDCEAQ